MDDQEALLALAAGTAHEQAAARAYLYDQYYARLVALLTKQFFQDEDCASAGAADAFMELFANAENEVPALLGRSDEPWRWLLRRAWDRTRDYRRKTRNIVKGVPKAEKANFVLEDIQNHLETLSRDDDPAPELLRRDQARAVRTGALQFLDQLTHPDRGVFLHDLVMRYGILTEEEAAAFDDELIGKTHEDYNMEQLKKRRQRLNDRLREFLKVRLS